MNGCVCSNADEIISGSARNIAETPVAQPNMVATQGVQSMLAEKFMLMLEALIRTQARADGAPRVVSTSRLVPVTLANPRHK